MMKEKVSNPLISVIIPVYNVDAYLRRCIDSVIDQTYRNLEIILVDDGSTDDSAKICDEYSSYDERINVIHKKNGGLVSARKAGIQLASGEYIAYVDGDDWVEDAMYQQLVGKIGDADIIISGVIRDYDGGIVKETNKIQDGIYEGEALQSIIFEKMIYTGKFFERGIQPHIFNSLYRHALIYTNQLRVDDRIRVGEDMACFYPTILDASKIVLTSDCFYHYKMRMNSIMGTNDGMELARYKILYKYLRERFSEKTSIQDCLKRQLEYMMLYVLMLKEINLLQTNEGVLFPYAEVKEGNRIVVYGAGRFGCELVSYLREQKKCEIVDWLDRSYSHDMTNTLRNKKFDYIIVAVLLKEISDEIVMELKRNGICESKICTVSYDAIESARMRLNEILQ